MEDDDDIIIEDSGVLFAALQKAERTGIEPDELVLFLIDGGNSRSIAAIARRVGAHPFGSSELALITRKKAELLIELVNGTASILRRLHRDPPPGCVRLLLLDHRGLVFVFVDVRRPRTDA